MIIPVLIPTKGRIKTSAYKLFDKKYFKVYHFIEPNEIEQYEAPNKINIGINNMGISYVRNYMLEWAKSNDKEWVIFCDDDITMFGKAINKRIVKQDASLVWIGIYNKIKNLPFEMAGIGYRQYAWSETKEYFINKRLVEVVVLVNVKKINWKYRDKFDMKEGRDFALQTIKNGYGVIKFAKYCFDSPDLGSKSGGLQDAYNDKRNEYAVIGFAKEWNPFIKIIKKATRLDEKIDVAGMANYYHKVVK
tara:strand:+ start:70 stop:813 length:744 start_codon:yes stop_codon:yes gene_type:complete